MVVKINSFRFKYVVWILDSMKRCSGCLSSIWGNNVNWLVQKLGWYQYVSIRYRKKQNASLLFQKGAVRLIG